MVLGLIGSLGNSQSSKAIPTATVASAAAHPTATHVPSMTEIRASHPPVADQRDIFVRPGDYTNRPITIHGTVTQVMIAPAGQVYELGKQGFLGLGGHSAKYRTVMVIMVANANDYLVVGFNGDLPGVYKGDDVSLSGQIIGSSGTTNAFGAGSDKPLFDAVLIDHAGIAATPAV